MTLNGILKRRWPKILIITALIMPAVPVTKSAPKILVTGATGFVAAWIISTLLERQYFVRGTVRSLQKGQYLKDKFASYGEKFELFVVKDMGVEGAFDDAVKGIDGILHVAALVTTAEDDPQAYIGPAVQGTTGILRSVLKFGSSVKRVVITSSCAAVYTPAKVAPYTEYVDSDWNETSVKSVEKLGRAADNIEKYRASKTLAERAAWDMYGQNKATVTWDLVTITPPYVLGPIAHEVPNPASLNVSTKQWYETVFHDELKAEPSAEFLLSGNSWVDVRDLAEAHVLALEKESAGGERFIVSAGPFIWQDWINVAKSLDSSPIPVHRMRHGVPVAEVDVSANPRRFNGTKIKKMLGLEYRTREEMTRGALADFASRGF
ncbi:D-lactaldehyde dehydrogenase [Mycena floridula]|nr:D-lactaldehyde dehydrogenase [Mycena floridula]